MDKEVLRLAINSFLRLYFNSCKELYKEIGFEKLTSKQFYYLKKIHKSDMVTASKFAELTKLSKPTVTEIINKFSKMGLLTKRVDETDRRVAYIELTEMGTILASTNELESNRITEKVMSKLDNEKLSQLVKLFEEMNEEE